MTRCAEMKRNFAAIQQEKNYLESKLRKEEDEYASILSELQQFVLISMKGVQWLSRLISSRSAAFKLPSRWKSRWLRPYLLDLWERRQLLGPDGPRQRSLRANWDYDVELYAFAKRIGEQFTEPNLRRAFVHRTYVEGQQKERSDLLLASSSAIDVDSPSSTVASLPVLEHNETLAEQGDRIINDYARAYLRYHLPLFPEEGIMAVCDSLTTNHRLATVASQLGACDLILHNDFPHADRVAADTLKAVVGALSVDQGNEPAYLLVQDLVLTQLADEDVNEMWYFKEPMLILTAYLKNKGQAAPEQRILRQTGSSTVTPTYVVGIYVNRRPLGSSPGETVDVAVEMAARNSLIQLWKSNSVQFSFGTRGREIDVTGHFDRPNWSIAKDLGIHVEADSTLYDEPLVPERLTLFYKNRIEKIEGTPYRRRLRHRFYPGTLNRKSPRRFIAPKPTSI
ncbi:hypothetical protein M513_04487 [Trichuris suis]|uniref:Large ribosomal subunit protein mL44 n=2 Tax=Trichuris suis TaxID=68888 RepID=A0A085MBE6_9BILA|nr:hypothetical protein M513_04487 [Trichuris suis]